MYAQIIVLLTFFGFAAGTPATLPRPGWLTPEQKKYLDVVQQDPKFKTRISAPDVERVALIWVESKKDIDDRHIYAEYYVYRKDKKNGFSYNIDIYINKNKATKASTELISEYTGGPLARSEQFRAIELAKQQLPALTKDLSIARMDRGDFIVRTVQYTNSGHRLAFIQGFRGTLVGLRAIIDLTTDQWLDYKGVRNEAAFKRLYSGAYFPDEKTRKGLFFVALN